MSAGALAAASLTLGVPRLIAAFWDSFHDTTVALVYARQPVAPGDLRGLVASRRLALRRVPSGKGHAELAAAYLALEERDGPASDADEDYLARAAEATRSGLALSPSDGRGWLQHAYLLMRDVETPTPEAAAALDLSMRIMPYDAPEFIAMRIHLSLLSWALFEDAARARVLAQIRLAWRLAPRAVVELATTPGFAPFLAAALGDEPEAIELLAPFLAEDDAPEI